MFEHLNDALRSKKPGYLYDAEIALIQILKRLVLLFYASGAFENQCAGSNQGHHHLYQWTLQGENHWSNSLLLLALQSNYLSRLFKSITGTTLINYIYQVRLSHFYAAVAAQIRISMIWWRRNMVWKIGLDEPGTLQENVWHLATESTSRNIRYIDIVWWVWQHTSQRGVQHVRLLHKLNKKEIVYHQFHIFCDIIMAENTTTDEKEDV